MTASLKLTVKRHGDKLLCTCPTVRNFMMMADTREEVLVKAPGAVAAQLTLYQRERWDGGVEFFFPEGV